ncbi:PH domain-containing protein [Pseudonocardia humida]|uniref:PH domain-containing protein n=1 Tax=Pseudonocardia humida TaxID=2800819 RepID=A0ABT1ABT0_9PSEU|nr:PH domain-containing protein [Pseudonocardia humida]MCO1660254.1 PH domain-containing protein [Pseudonocardia humida]
MSSTPPEPAPRAVFRPSSLQVLAAVAVAFCATPFAFGAPLFFLVYLVPLGFVVWTLRVRTVVDAESLTVRRLLGGRRVPWSEISSLRLVRGSRHTSSRVSAVLTDGAELPLPAVTVRDLPQLAAVSGGRLPDPAGE